MLGDTLIGVWDVDSPVPGRFDAEDRIGMQVLCNVYMDSLQPSQAGEEKAA